MTDLNDFLSVPVEDLLAALLCTKGVKCLAL